MRINLFPQETRGLELLLELCGLVRRQVDALSEMLGVSPEDRPPLVDRLAAAEAKATDVHYALLTHLRTSFVNPLPREDLYTFSRLLHAAAGRLVAVGDLVVQMRLTWLSARAAEQLELLGRQAELAESALGEMDQLDELEETWLQMVRTTRRAERTHRVWLGEIAELQKTSSMVKHRSVADQLLASAWAMRDFADHLGRVLVKES